MPDDFDVIVIGSGAGGGTFAYACAREGKRTLLIERGRKAKAGQDGHDEQAMLIAKEPYDDRPIAVNGTSRRLYMGGVLGGGTALYGAALMRPSAADFHPGKHYRQRLPPSLGLADRPEALEPYYSEAEKLYHVSGGGRRSGRCRSRRGISLCGHSDEADQPPADRRQSRPAACIRSGCLWRSTSKRLPWLRRLPRLRLPERRRIRGAGHQHRRARVLTNVEVERFSRDGGQFDGVCVRDRAAARPPCTARLHARGSPRGRGSPTVLLRSESAGRTWVGIT